MSIEEPKKIDKKEEYEKFLKDSQGSYKKHLENLKKLRELFLQVADIALLQ